MASTQSSVNPAMSAYHHPGGLSFADNQGHANNPLPNGQFHPIHIPVDAAMGNVINQMNAMALAGNGMTPGGGYPAHMAAPAYLFPDNQYILAPVPGGHQPVNMMDPSYGAAPAYITGASHPHPGQYPQPAMIPYSQVVPFTPRRPTGAQNRSDRGQGEAPPLLDSGRRGSYSTNESTPATPYYPGTANRDNGHRVSIVGLDQSAYTTPSPQQGPLVSLSADQTVIAKKMPTALDQKIDDLLDQDPPIPAAVPAVFTPLNQIKTLEQSLENRIPGNRNVYIRGLHPTTDDNLLYKYTERFGAVETSKAIIDTTTGACKGFGFAKFFDVRDSEKCIRGFHQRGYEVGFARESFNSRLKAEGDEKSTNLYISNLSKHMTEMELASIFAGYTILSSKILRDSMGNSRGVGFARFESREICDEIIKNFNGLPIAIGLEGNSQPMVMNIRYADTPAQKELKRVTAERRQFRTNEYNIGAYGTAHVGMSAQAYGVMPVSKRSYASPIHVASRAYIAMPSNGVNSRSGKSLSSLDGIKSVSQPTVIRSLSPEAPVEQESVDGEQQTGSDGRVSPQQE